MSYCDQNFLKVSAERATQCKHLHCVNCCNHILLVLKYAAQQSIVSEVVGVSDDAGFNKIRNHVQVDKVTSCRKECIKTYQVTNPIVVPPPANDPELGMQESIPAKSCMDIMKWGGPPESDVKWIKTKGHPFKMYCDQEMDSGGWSVFYNYIHHPYEDYQIDGSVVPEDIQHARSHIVLKDIGFSSTDVAELIFWCTTNHKEQGKTIYIYFKTRDPDVLKVAMTGDQIYLKPKSWKNGITPIEPTDPKYRDEGLQKRTNFGVIFTPKLKNGGFWNTPFSDTQGKWTIRGNGRKGVWLCGDDATPGGNGATYETEHRVYFRGQPPSEEFHAKRQIEKLEQFQSRRRR